MPLLYAAWLAAPNGNHDAVLSLVEHREQPPARADAGAPGEIEEKLSRRALDEGWPPQPEGGGNARRRNELDGRRVEVGERLLTRTLRTRVK